jgi:hypothetical protein
MKIYKNLEICRLGLALVTFRTKRQHSIDNAQPQKQRSRTYPPHLVADNQSPDLWQTYRDALSKGIKNDSVRFRTSVGKWERLHGDGKSSVRGVLRTLGIEQTDGSLHLKLEFNEFKLFQEQVKTVDFTDEYMLRVSEKDALGLRAGTELLNEEEKRRFAELKEWIHECEMDQDRQQTVEALKALDNGMKVNAPMYTIVYRLLEMVLGMIIGK